MKKKNRSRGYRNVKQQKAQSEGVYMFNPGCATAAVVSQKTRAVLVSPCPCGLQSQSLWPQSAEPSPRIPFPLSRSDQIERSTTVAAAHIEIEEP
jgi:hypothetical protein